MSGQQYAPYALYPRERPGTHFTGGWVGPRAGLAENLIPIGIQSQTVQPIVSRYTDWATWPTHFYKVDSFFLQNACKTVKSIYFPTCRIDCGSFWQIANLFPQVEYRALHIPTLDVEWDVQYTVFYLPNGKSVPSLNKKLQEGTTTSFHLSWFPGWSWITSVPAKQTKWST